MGWQVGQEQQHLQAWVLRAGRGGCAMGGRGTLPMEPAQLAILLCCRPGCVHMRSCLSRITHNAGCKYRRGGLEGRVEEELEGRKKDKQPKQL